MRRGLLALCCTIGLSGAGCASHSDNTNTNPPISISADPTAPAGSVGKCVEFEPVPGHKVCLLDQPQGSFPTAQALQAEPVSLPDAVDHTAQVNGCTPVGDQGLCGWCVAFSTVAAVAATDCSVLPDAKGISEASLWSQGGGDVTNCDGGWNLMAAARAFQTKWMLPWVEWPWNQRTLTPSEDVTRCGVARAPRWTVVGMGDVQGLKTALAKDLNVSYAVLVPDRSGWSMGDGNYKNGTISMPAIPPDHPPGHAILIVGYNDAEKMFIFRNSWSTAWGNQGYGKLPYEYIEKFGDGGVAPSVVHMATARELLVRQCCTKGSEYCEGECCEAGKCHDGVCTGCTDPCATPPGTRCADGDTLLAYDQGHCDAASNSCVYPERSTSCRTVDPSFTCQHAECLQACSAECQPPARCEDGQCVNDPLSGYYVRIAGGTFTMGSPTTEPRPASEEPGGGEPGGSWWCASSGSDASAELQHRVAVTHTFWMKSTEVTQAEWRAVMGTSPWQFTSCGDSCPVENVSWDDAIEYLNGLSRRSGLPECYVGSRGAWTAPNLLTCGGYRLPTEAEWEYAARAGTNGPFGGDTTTMDQVGWSQENSGGHPHTVGQKQANAWELYDMHGNVWEWVHDGCGPYPAGYTINPLGPDAPATRNFRGGSWDREAGYARAAARATHIQAYKNSNLGFRPVRTILSAPEIEVCQGGNGRCPPGCSAANDSDCPAVCGNGIIEPGETCDDGNTVSGDRCSSTCQVEPLVSIAITPSTRMMVIGETFQLTATGTYSGGSHQDLSSSVDWSSSGAAATVGAGGLVRAVSEGTVTISARDPATLISSEASHGSATIIIFSSTLVSISVTPTSTTTPPGVDIAFRAVGHLQNGTTSDVSSLVNWSSSASSVADVGTTGTMRGVATTMAAGTARIIASEPISGISSATSNTSATVNVSTASTLRSLAVTPRPVRIAEGRTRAFQATGTFSDGHSYVMTDGVTWASSEPTHATVSNTRGTRGVVTAVLVGTTVISVRHSGSGVSSDASDQSADVTIFPGSGGPCQSTRDCLGVEACGSIVTSTGAISPHCAPSNASGAATGTACTGGQQCSSNLCLRNITNQCTVVCDDVNLDCPAGFACTGYGLGAGPTWVFMCSQLCEDNAGCAGGPPGEVCSPRVYDRRGAWSYDMVCSAPAGTAALGAVCQNSGDCINGLCLRTSSNICTDASGCQAEEVCECRTGTPPPCADGTDAYCMAYNCSAACNEDSDCSAPGQPLTQCRFDTELTLPDQTILPITICGRPG